MYLLHSLTSLPVDMTATTGNFCTSTSVTPTVASRPISEGPMWVPLASHTLATTDLSWSVTCNTHTHTHTHTHTLCINEPPSLVTPKLYTRETILKVTYPCYTHVCAHSHTYTDVGCINTHTHTHTRQMVKYDY